MKGFEVETSDRKSRMVVEEPGPATARALAAFSF